MKNIKNTIIIGTYYEGIIIHIEYYVNFINTVFNEKCQTVGKIFAFAFLIELTETSSLNIVIKHIGTRSIKSMLGIL